TSGAPRKSRISDDAPAGDECPHTVIMPPTWSSEVQNTSAEQISPGKPQSNPQAKPLIGKSRHRQTSPEMVFQNFREPQLVHGSPMGWAARIGTCRHSWSWCRRAPGTRRHWPIGSGAAAFCRPDIRGVKFRSGADPALYLSNPPGYSSEARRRFLDDLAKLNEVSLQNYQDPEISTRIAQYEMAYRMQTSVPELTDLSKEPASTFELYGPDSRKPGTYAANCVLARRLAERGVRFIQLFHRGW